jgi:hypothetical protein
MSMNTHKSHVDLFGIDLQDRAWIDRRDQSEAGKLRRLARAFDRKGMPATAMLLRNDAQRVDERERAEVAVA